MLRKRGTEDNWQSVDVFLRVKAELVESNGGWVGGGGEGWFFIQW